MSSRSSKKSNVNMNGAPNVNQLSIQHGDDSNNTSSLSPQSTTKKKRKKRKRSKKDTTNNEQQQSASTTNDEQQNDYNECKATVSKYFQTNNNNTKPNGIAANTTLDIGTTNNSYSDDDMDTKSSTANKSCWSPMQQSDNDEQEFNEDGLDDTPAKKHKKNHKKKKHKNEKHKKEKSSKSNDTNGSSDNMSTEMSDNNNDVATSSRVAALGNNNSSDDDSDRNNSSSARSRSSSGDDEMNSKLPHNQNSSNTESLEELKQSIMGRQIKSMYDIDHTSEALLSKQSSQQLSNGITSGASTLNGTTVANQLRHELSCPICHDILYNPCSLGKSERVLITNRLVLFCAMICFSYH